MTTPTVHPVTLTGHLIHLREMTSDDVDAVHAIVGDPEVCETLIFHPKTREETAGYVRRAIEEAEQRPRNAYFLAVTQADTGELVGTARLGLGEFASGNIGYAIRRDHWNRGYATEATRLLTRFGFDTLGLHRVWASHGPANPSSGRVLVKAGMAYEGTLRENVLDKGEWRDSLVYAAIAASWSSYRPL